MCGVRMLHFLKDWWKFIQINQYYDGFNRGEDLMYVFILILFSGFN